MSDEEKEQEGASGAEEAVEEESEDIEAFLASLEEDAESAAPAPAPAARASESEPDPFADAFAALADEHADEVEAELAAKYTEPEPEPEPEPAPEPAREVASEDEGALVAPPEREEAPKKEKPKKEARPAPVETVRSPGFRFAVGSARFMALAGPAFLFFWLAGAHLSNWVRTGWVVALVAAAVAFVLPLGVRFGTGKGKALWWTFGVGVLGCAALIAPMSRATAERVAEYGHWPVSAVAQLSGWAPDGAAVKASATVSGWAASGLDAIRPAEAPLPEALALGSREGLEAYAKKLDEEAEAREASGGGKVGEVEGAGGEEKAEEKKPAAEDEPAEEKPSE
jgi:hypothetical protein